MTTNRVFAFGAPENDGERRVLRFLDERLPGDYRIYHSLELAERGHSFEYDVLVLAPYALFALEVKDWPGRIRGNDREWVLQNGAARPNPVPLINKKARILKDRIAGRLPLLKNALYVAPLVVVADEHSRLSLSGDCAGQTATLADVIARLTDRSDARWARVDLGSQVAAVHDALTENFRPRQGPLEVGAYRLIEQLRATDLYTEWLAENRYAERGPRVRLKIYAPDPHAPKGEQEEQRRLAERDFAAAANMGRHAHVRAARDFFPDEQGRYIVVLDDLPGASLAAELAAGRELVYETKLRVVEDIADGLAHAADCKVVHRDVRPENIWLSPSGAVLINFDCARVAGSGTVAAHIAEDLDPHYLAPEVSGAAAHATSASDVYALGVVMYDLLTGGALPHTLVGAKPSDHDPLIPAELDELTRAMLAATPAERPTAAEVRERLEALREGQHTATHGPSTPAKTVESDELTFQVDDAINDIYVVREVLGTGTSGRAYRVYSAVTDHEYTMKVFRESGRGLDDARQEFAALAQVAHPRVARVWHADRLSPGVYFLLTDYIAGRSLQEVLDERPLGPWEALRLARELLDALSYTHARGLVHCDVKPSNIILAADGAHLIDFGIAAATDSRGSGAIGTPMYMPPDVNTCAATPNRDLFAVGAILYLGLTGKHPYGGAPRLGAMPEDPQTVEPQLSGAMAQILRRAVAPQAGQRFDDAGEFLAALTGINEPLRAAAPSYPLARDITIPREEWERPNYNPYLTRFLTLYSQNRVDNSGTRGYDEVSQATYVETNLETRLAPDVLDGKLRLVVITGNAGDGKTAFLQRMERGLASPGDGRTPVRVTAIPSGNGATFEIQGRHYRTNYDGSQNEDGRQNDDALADFFQPFAGTAAQVNERSQNVTRLIAINEGKLRDFLKRRRSDFTWLADSVEAYLDRGIALPPGYLMVNLNDRSVAAGEENIVERQIARLTDPSFWEPCRGCQYADRCMVKFNVDTLNHPELGPRVRQRLAYLFALADLRGRLHITMRALRSALAYLLFGEDDCSGIARRLDEPIPTSEADEAVLRRYYYNAIAADRPTGDSDLEEADRLLGLLAEADVGLGANPPDDRQLFLARGLASVLLPEAESRSTYDRELLQSLGEQLTGQPLEETIEMRRRLHAMLRRKAFFERADDGWQRMLPYPDLALVRGAVREDPDSLAELKQLIIKGINRDEGLPEERSLALRLARGVPGSVQSFRVFPEGEFELRVARSSTANDYVENAATALELVHRPGTNGHAGRPTLRLELDLIQLLLRMARGYAPSASEWRGPLINLSVFRTLLDHEPYDELLLLSRADGQRYRVQKRGGQIRLIAEKETADAAH